MAEMIVYGLREKAKPGVIRYVGQTTGLRHRLAKHSRSAKSHPHLPIARWIAKRGWEAIEHVVLEQCDSIEALNRAEVSWIAKMRAAGQADLNVGIGGGSNAGYRHTEETKARFSEARKGRVISPTQRQLLSETFRGERHPSARLSDAQAREILAALWAGSTIQSLADRYGVSIGVIGRIRTGAGWKHIERPAGKPPSRSTFPISKIHEIRAFYLESGLKYGEVAEHFGVSVTRVSTTIRGDKYGLPSVSRGETGQRRNRVQFRSN